ncbi:dTDP-4-dehydrorhamnose 3,5-epimerase [Bacteriovoracaceae bacterium]|nr:dTDP-4-dehydrorhamnose 3,5-epimerase [Bacteriovoracaceae bacterium]
MFSVEKTPIEGLLIVVPKIFEDDRGYFFESYHIQKFCEMEINTDFVQDNESFSTYGTIRGLHFQKAPFEQAKLVRVLMGEVYDVAVDLRPLSKTFGQSFGTILSETNKKQLFIPRGFAHGFSVLSRSAQFSYKCDNYYSRESEDGIRFDDSDLEIEWRIPNDATNVSEKDLQLGTLDDYKRQL